MPNYVIHIGPYKTGTTYLQSIFYGLSAQLRDLGVFYPLDQGNPGHLRVPAKLLKPECHADLAAEFAAYGSSGCDTVVISAEDLSQLDVPQIDALRRMIGDHPVRIVFYCRNPAAVTVSNWGESIRHGHSLTLEKSLAWHIAHPFVAPAINYAIILDRYIAVFGRAAIDLVSLDALSRHDLELEHHFAATFLGLSKLPPPKKPPNRNAGLKLADAEIIRMLNAMRLERVQERDATMRKLYIRRKPQAPLALTRAAIERHYDSMLFDETSPKMQSLHNGLVEQFGSRVVQPSLTRRFFVPKKKDIRIVRPDYIEDPGVRDELEALYTEFADSVAAVR